MNALVGHSTETLNMENITNQFIGRCKNFLYPLANKVEFQVKKIRMNTEINPSDIDIAAFQVYFPSLEITIHRQRFDYTIDQVAKPTYKASELIFKLFSELGGAAGLVLGISLITIVRQVDATITWIIRHFKLKFGYGKNFAPMKSSTVYQNLIQWCLKQAR